MPRLKLPPYAKQLREMRDKGDHPWVVVVNYSKQWVHRYEKHPSIMVPAADYESGVYDFSVLAGLRVFLCLNEIEYKEAMPLVVELATYCSALFIEFFYDGKLINSREASEMFLTYSLANWKGGERPWPAGWSNQLQHDYESRFKRLEQFYIQEAAAL